MRFCVLAARKADRNRKLAFTSQVNRNRKKLTVSRKKAKILTVNRKSHYPIETLISLVTLLVNSSYKNKTFHIGNPTRVNHVPRQNAISPHKNYTHVTFSFECRIGFAYYASRLA